MSRFGPSEGVRILHSRTGRLKYLTVFDGILGSCSLRFLSWIQNDPGFPIDYLYLSFLGTPDDPKSQRCSQIPTSMDHVFCSDLSKCTESMCTSVTILHPFTP